MVREARYIREVSPFLQGLLTRIMEKCITCRDKSDFEGYADCLLTLYMVSPPEVAAEVRQELKQMMQVEDGDPVKAFIDSVWDECSEIMSKYGIPMRKKRSLCVSRAIELLDKLFHLIVMKLHENNVFIIYKSELVGEHK